MNPVWDSRFEALVMQFVDSQSVSTLSPTDDLVGRGLDSLAVVELIVALEDAYDIEIPDDRLTQETFATPGNLWSVVSELIPVKQISQDML